MVNLATRDATYEDLLAVPEPLVAEILDGTLAHPRYIRAGAGGGSSMNTFTSASPARNPPTWACHAMLDPAGVRNCDKNQKPSSK